jgi:hypothetical protein
MTSPFSNHRVSHSGLLAEFDTDALDRHHQSV